VLIKNKKRENMRTDRCGNTRKQKCRAKGSRKEVKYKRLCIEIQRLWNLKCKVIPVTTGETGMVTNVFLRKNLEAVSGKHSTDYYYYYYYYYY
jgi:hypothetical protein